MPETPVYDAQGLNTEALTWALKALNQKATQYRKARRYYEGKHPLAFITPKFRAAFAAALEGIKANFCPGFIEIPANRLSIDKFVVKLSKGKSAPEGLEAIMEEIMELNRMDSREYDLFFEGLLCGDSYLLVWPEEREDGTMDVIFYPQMAGTCAAQYHPEKPGYIVRAAKWWTDNGKTFLNIYTADTLEKYVAQGSGLPGAPGAFTRATNIDIQGNPELWPLPNPYKKCPVFHLANGKARKSELQEIYDLQNALNLALCNMLVMMEFYSYPQRYALGFDPRKAALTEGDDGLKQWQAAMDAIFYHWDKDLKLGQFDPSDPTPFLSVMKQFREMMCEIKGTPPFYFSMDGTIPSGVALKILERRLNDLINRLKKAWGNVLADAMLLALKMKGAVKDGSGVRLSTTWVDTEPKDDLAEAQAQVQKQELGVSKKQSQREMGYTEAQIEQNAKEKAEEETSAGNLMGKLFNQGSP